MCKNNVQIREARKDADKVLLSFGGTPLKFMGRFKADIVHAGRSSEERFYVVDVDEKSILGAETAKRIGVLKIVSEQVKGKEGSDTKYPF